MRQSGERFAGLCRTVGLAVWAGTTLAGLVLGLAYEPGKIDAHWTAHGKL